MAISKIILGYFRNISEPFLGHFRGIHQSTVRKCAKHGQKRLRKRLQNLTEDINCVITRVFHRSGHKNLRKSPDRAKLSVFNLQYNKKHQYLLRNSEKTSYLLGGTVCLGVPGFLQLWWEAPPVPVGLSPTPQGVPL